MSRIIEKTSLDDKIKFLKKCYLANQEKVNSFDCLYSLNEEFSAVIESYLNLSDNKLIGTELAEYRINLQNSFLQYIKENNISNIDPDNQEILSRIAFYRLSEACKAYYTEKLLGQDSQKIDNLKRLSKELMKDFRSIKT